MQRVPMLSRRETGVGEDRDQRDVIEELRFQATLLAAVGQAVIATRSDRTIIYWNVGAERLYGWKAEEVLGRDIVDVLPTRETPEESRARLSRVTAGGTPQDRSEWLIQRRDGTWIPVLAQASMIRDASGAIIGIIGVSTDISERKHAEEAIAASEERYRTLVETSLDGICIVDLNACITFANAKLAALLEVETPEELIGQSAIDIVVSQDRELARRELRAVIEHGSADVRLRAGRKDGSTIPIHVRGELIRDPEGRPLGVTAVIRDIGEQVEYETQLQRLALHDALTDLPNRTLLLDRLQHAVSVAARQNQNLALLLMDLDRFKEINDTYGHQVGDRVLQKVARRLSGRIRQADTVARLGGDEFAILLPNTDLADAVRVAAKLNTALEESIELQDQRFQVGASLGIALFPEHGDTPELLLARADVAMYAAKRANIGYASYTPEQDPHNPLRLVVTSELRAAIEIGQLVLNFQPKLNLRSGMIEDVEALVRWQHPTHGVIPPDRFISVAEHSGLIRPLTTSVIRMALESCRDWTALGFDLGVAVNLSARSLHDPDLASTLQQALDESGVRPSRLTVEITESTLMAEPERAMEVLLGLKETGIRVSIDDFGTGYSSLGYLRQLRADELKIDRSFVLDLEGNDNNTFIVRAIADLGHNFGLDVVAEGVESRPALDLVRKLGCDWAQGYHLGRPQPCEELTAWLREQPHIRLQRGTIVAEADAGVTLDDRGRERCTRGGRTE